MTRLLTLPFRLAWIPIAWFLRLLGFGAGVKRHRWQPPAADAEHHVWAVVRERRETHGNDPVVRLRPDRRAHRAARAHVALGRLTVLRSTSGKALVPIAAVLAVAIATVGAFAYYTSSGTGSASASVGTLNPPTGVTASPSGSTVTVSWAAPSGGVAPQGYYVQRYLGSTPSPACGTSPSALTTPASAITCPDTGVPAGTYTYTVTAVYNSWTATSSAGGSVTVTGLATKLAFTTAPQTSTAGVTSGSIIVQREDASGTPTTVGTTTVNLSTSSTGAVFRDSTDAATITTVTIGPGASSASFEYKDTVAGGPTITAADAAAVLASATQVETVNPAGANKLVFTTPPVGNVSEGTNFSASPAVSNEDTFGNVVTTDTGNVTLAIASYSAGSSGGTTQGILACLSGLTVAVLSGVAHFTACQITGSAAAGTYTLSATRSGLTTAVSGNVTINAGTASAAQSTLTPTTSSIVANGTSTQILTVQAKDANGNSLTTGGATVTITRSSGTGTIGTVTDHSNGTYTATVTSPAAVGSGTFVATLGGSNVLSGGGSQTQATVTYLSGAVSAARSTLTPTSSSIAANGVSTQVLTVQAEDANGNNLTSGGATVTITKSSGTGTISSVTDNGTGTYTAIVTSPAAAGSGVFVATIGGSAVQSGGGSQTQATVSYTAAGSAVAHVQDAAFTGSGAALNTVSPSLTSPPANGDTLIVFVGDDGSNGATVSGVSGGGVQTWAKATSVSGSGAPGNGNNNNGELEIWYGVVNCSGACNAGNEAVTVSLSATTNVQMATVSEWSGIVTSSPVDSAASLAVATRSGTSFTTSSLTPTQTGDLVVSSGWVDNKTTGVTAAQNATSGYTQLAQTNATGSFFRGYDAYQFDGNTNPIAATWPDPGSNSYAWAIAAFKTTTAADTTPPTGSITAPANGGAVHGTVTVSSSSADTGSGVASAQFQYSPHGANTWTTIGTDTTGPYSSPWNTTGLTAGQYDLRVITTDNATNSFTSMPLVTVTVDNTAPTGSISYSNGYNTSGTVLVAFNASDSGSGLNTAAGQLSRASATLSNGSCLSFGAFTPVAGSAGAISSYSDSSVSTGNCYEYEYVVPDNAGNVATITSASVVKVDKAGPTSSLALTGQTGGASYLSGNTIYYQGSSAGSFQLQDTVGDAASGPASSQFGSLGGAVANWTFAGSIVSSPAGGPYVSSGFSWVSGTTGSATEVVTGADAAGNTTAAPTITFTNDTSPPSGGSVTANGSAGMSWVKSASIPVSFSAGTDGGSGVNASGGRLLRGSSAYNAATATCGAISTFPTQVGSTGLSSPVTDTSALSAGTCYAYEYQVADNVGNVQTYGPSAAVAFDNTVPAVTVTNAAGQAASTGSLPITFTVTFSEPVLGFTVGDLTRTGTSTGGSVGLSGTGPLYTITVTNPGSNLSNGSIGFTIAAGSVTDDALNNNTASTGSPDSVSYDSSPPLTTFTFPGSSAYGSAAYATGCSPVGICGNATDLSGVAVVRVSVQRTGDGDYWNGSTFINSPSELFNTASLTNGGATATAWDLAMPQPGDGSYLVHVQAKDTLGNDSAPAYTSSETFSIKSQAPAAPGSVSLANGQGVGAAYINNSTKGVVSVTVSGIAEIDPADTVTVTISDGTHQVTGTAPATSGSVTVTGINASSLNDGLNNIVISATETDQANNTSGTTTAATNYSKDVVAPDGPTSVAIANGGGTGNAFINSSNQTAVSYSVTIPPGANDQASDTVTVTLTSGVTVSGTKSPSNPGGSVTVSGVDAHTLTDGTVSVAATATDRAGNVSVAATANTTKDTLVPAAPTVSSTSPLSPANNNSPAVIGSAVAGSTVKIYTDSLCTSAVVGTGSASTFGSPGLTASVGDNTTTTLFAATTDTAGNTSACSTTSAVYVEDSTAPTLISLVMLDTNGNGKVDQVKATFSEALASSTATAPWTLTNVPSGGALSSVAVSGAVATLTLTEGAGAAETSVGSFKVALAASASGIRDAAGNQSSFAAAAPADGAAPALVSMVMQDTNGNGKVDQVKATFSEALASSTATAPWTLTNVPSGGALSSVAVSGAVATLTLTEGAGAAETSVGSFKVALAASASGIRDAAGNQSSFAAAAPADGAAPALVSMVMQDTNGNGKVDHVLVTFSEALAASTLTTQWALANVPSGGTLTSVSTSGSTATLTLTEGASAANTAVGSFTVALAGNASGIRDAAGNLSSFAATAPSDGAAPVRTAMTMLDGNGNGKIDTVTVTFSENLAASTATAPWTLANVPSGGTLLSVSTSGNTATLNLTEGAGAANTAVGTFTVALAASAAGITDAVGNQASFAAAGPADGAAPALVSMVMEDTNTNGKVDHVVATFSEPLAASTLTTAWTLTNVPSGGSLASVAVATSTATLTLTPGAGAADTSVGSFQIALVTNAAGIRDAAGNLASFAATAPTDGAGPVPVSVTDTNGTTDGLMQPGDTLVVTFSEPIASAIASPITITETDPSGGGNDTITIPGLTDGALDSGSGGYILNNNTSKSFSGSTLVLSNGDKSLTTTVGTTAGGTGTVGAGGPGTFVFSPAASLTDAAGNAATGSISVPAFRIF